MRLVVAPYPCIPILGLSISANTTINNELILITRLCKKYS